MHSISSLKKAYCILACLIMFQSIPLLKADIKDHVFRAQKQLFRSFAMQMDDLFKDKLLLTVGAFILVCLSYSYYIKGRANRVQKQPKDPVPFSENFDTQQGDRNPQQKDSESEAQDDPNAGKEIDPNQEKDSNTVKSNINQEEDSALKASIKEVEGILKLEKVPCVSSYGCWGEELYIRTEAMKRVLNASDTPDCLWMQSIASDKHGRMKQLLQDSRVKMGLIRNQEDLLHEALARPNDLWGLDMYGIIARRTVGLSELTKMNPSIGIGGLSNPQKKEAYEKLDPQQRYNVAFETFVRAEYGYSSADIPRLTHWQENSTRFKEPLKRIVPTLIVGKKK